VLTRDFDEDIGLVTWTTAGIWFAANITTSAYLYRLDPATRATARVAPDEGWTGTGWNLTRDGRFVTYVGGDATHYPEVFAGRTGDVAGALTRMSPSSRAGRWARARSCTGRVATARASRACCESPRAGGRAAGDRCSW
jgi:hypothetical protein